MGLECFCYSWDRGFHALGDGETGQVAVRFIIKNNVEIFTYNTTGLSFFSSWGGGLFYTNMGI